MNVATKRRAERSAQAQREHKAPQLYIGTFSGTILCAPKWRTDRRNPDLRVATGETYDVTRNALAVVVRYLEENDVTETDTKTGQKCRLRIVREAVEAGHAKGS